MDGPGCLLEGLWWLPELGAVGFLVLLLATIPAGIYLLLHGQPVSGAGLIFGGVLLGAALALEWAKERREGGDG